MYLVVIAWVYVVLMMAVAEATNSNGSVLGAIITFLLYGVGPVAIVAYIMGTPGRKRAIKAREAAELAAARQGADALPSPGSSPSPGANSSQPDAGREAPADTVAPVRKES